MCIPEDFTFTLSVPEDGHSIDVMRTLADSLGLTFDDFINRSMQVYADEVISTRPGGQLGGSDLFDAYLAAGLEEEFYQGAD